MSFSWPRFTASTLAVVGTLSIAACSSSSSDSSTPTYLNGTYAWDGDADAGAPPSGILTASFFADQYSMFVSCADDKVDGCFDYGSYSLDTSSTTITFVSDIDGKVRALPFSGAVSEMVPPADTTTQDLKVADETLVGGSSSGTGLVSGGSAPLTKPSAASIITKFGLGGDGGSSGMKLVCTGPDTSPNASTPAAPVSTTSLHFDDDTQGHVNNNSSDYNLWTKNCHSAANYTLVNHPPGTWGIISCEGNVAVKTQGGHTFNYQVKDDGSVTFWNWTTTCVANDKMYTAPPDISSGQALNCVKQDCNTCADGQTGSCNQYYSSGSKTTSALPPGQMVENPSTANCVLKGQQQKTNKATFGNCNSCCNSYANFWSSNQIAAAGNTLVEKNSYLTACLNNCMTAFGMGVNSPMALSGALQ